MSRIRPTIDDVARLAGVSIKTVSRVFNKEPHVRPATHERVMVAAAKLEYSVRLWEGGEELTLPEGGTAVIRYRGEPDRAEDPIDELLAQALAFEARHPPCSSR